MEFHHVGIPTETRRENEKYLDGGKVFITDADASPYNIEWLRFEADSPMPEELKTIPHVAFKVDNLEAALEGKNVLIEPWSPMEGLQVAFIMDDGAPIEFMQMD